MGEMALWKQVEKQGVSRWAATFLASGLEAGTLLLTPVAGQNVE
jgi:hypothetical protein